MNEGNFNLYNIAAKLFRDYVRFHKNNSIHAMRFSNDSPVKDFWTLGLQLFHAKFIRSMGGYKCIVKLSGEAASTRDSLTTEISQIN